MTMMDGKCEVCGRSPAIGVACTSIPFSCSYCAECCKRGSDPAWVLSYLIEGVEGDLSRFDPAALKQLNTYHDGEYINLEQWAKLRSKVSKQMGE